MAGFGGPPVRFQAPNPDGRGWQGSLFILTMIVPALMFIVSFEPAVAFKVLLDGTMIIITFSLS